MQINAISSRETHNDISLDDWADLVGFDRNIADELYNRLADTGKAAIGEWELTALSEARSYSDLMERYHLDRNNGMSEE